MGLGETRVAVLESMINGLKSAWPENIDTYRVEFVDQIVRYALEMAHTSSMAAGSVINEYTNYFAGSKLAKIERIKGEILTMMSDMARYGKYVNEAKAGGYQAIYAPHLRTEVFDLFTKAIEVERVALEVSDEVGAAHKAALAIGKVLATPGMWLTKAAMAAAKVLKPTYEYIKTVLKWGILAGGIYVGYLVIDTIRDGK